jgi:NADH:ubiquinone reductase (H+-translocating)
VAVTEPNASLRIAIIGGGYAGIATAIELHRLGVVNPTLFDSRSHHQKITQWHKLARGERASKYETPFAQLSRRFGFHFQQAKISILELLQNPAGTLGAEFDAIVIAQGSAAPAHPAEVITLDALRDDKTTQQLVQSLQKKNISVIGGGPTGIQFAFEFAARGNKVELYEARDRLLPAFDNSLSETALAAAKRAGIEVRLRTEFISFSGGKIHGRSGTHDNHGGADYVLFVPGVRATPSFTCDGFGRIDSVSPKNRFYAAGDNSFFSGGGLNARSAQAAVRKGQHVARTLVADLTGLPAKEYTYSELGYFVSLGPTDAVGYLLSQKTAFHGRAALFMKEATEKQYNLYLAGLNVYP